MDIKFTFYLSYFIKFYILCLLISVGLNSYTLYDYGLTDCPHNRDLFKQSILAIFTGFFTIQLLVSILLIPETTQPTNSTDNKTIKNTIMTFLICNTITTILAGIALYIFISCRIYELNKAALGTCSRLYFDAVFSNTIISVLPSSLITIGFILYMISWMINIILNLCACCSDYDKQNRRHQQTQTRKSRDTEPEFINPNDATFRLDMISSEDEFQMDAPELENTKKNNIYPSRKYSYPSTANTNTPTERAWSPGFSDTIPLLTNYGK